MPTLHWIGKDKVINHHRDVPFHVLNEQYTFNTEESISNNKIIHGDNLLALKSLLPQYEGKIKCIYIDPPYNTGNEGWVYNDNVNDPKIKKWLAQTVGKEGEDLSRHDKWLCMMYPRLKLLHQLLAKDGAIFISIDDNEQANLKLMCDEIFGGSNFLANVAWEKRFTRSNNAKLFYSVKDSILIYRKTQQVDYLREGRTDKSDSIYTNPDDDIKGDWASGSYVNPATKKQRPNLVYAIINPFTKEEINHPTHAWKYSYEQHLKHVAENKLYWGIDGKNTFPRIKQYLSEAKGLVPIDIWFQKEVGTTDDGGKILANIFGEKAIFETPKPTKLIEKMINILCNNDDIILDSFAGSGTTAHAVLNLNKQDGGNRKFILIEMEDYAETITAERVKRVIKGYSNTEGVGGDFTYHTLGASLFDEDGNLNEAVGKDKIREYVYYTETEQYIAEAQTTADDNPYLMGKKDTTAYYFYYEPTQLTTLDMAFLGTIRTVADMYIIYADNVLLSAEFMKSRNIIFKKIPRDVRRF